MKPLSEIPKKELITLFISETDNFFQALKKYPLFERNEPELHVMRDRIKEIVTEMERRKQSENSRTE